MVCSFASVLLIMVLLRSAKVPEALKGFAVLVLVAGMKPGFELKCFSNVLCAYKSGQGDSCQLK